MKLAFLMVLYNKKIEDSSTYQSLVDLNQHVYIYDNSDNQEIINCNQSFSPQNITYLTSNDNVGLSIAYNQLIDCIKHDNINPDFIILLDDDSSVSSEYLNCVNQITDNNKIYTPIIKSGEQIINPRYVNENFIKEILNKNKYNSEDKLRSLVGTTNLFAINSGLVIPFNVFNQFEYNDKIKLDCVDDYFCKTIYQLGYIIEILPITLEHSFHMKELAGKKYPQLRPRVVQRLADLKVYNGEKHINYFIMKLAFLTQYVLGTKDIRFYKLLFK